MPRLSVWFVRAASLYLALGFTLGALMLADKGVPFAPWLVRLLPAHVEFVLFGWTVQLAMGVAFWILPRFEGGASRGRVWLAWLALGLLNAGVWLAGAGAVLDWPPALLLLGRVCEAAAAAAFALHAWPRIKPMSR